MNGLDEIKLVQHWSSLCRSGSDLMFLRDHVDIPEFLIKDSKTFHRYKLWLLESPSRLTEMRSLFMEPKLVRESHSDPFLLSVVQFIKDEFTAQLAVFRNMRRIADLSSLLKSFPLARQLSPRVFHTHFGPPNSGKTHNALLSLSNAQTGVYAAPLRILAWEAYERLNEMGIACELRTGQERLRPKDPSKKATHIACTVEMVPTDLQFEVAVIDEIQLLSDISRGSAWYRAIVGVASPIVHLCGDGRVSFLVKHVLGNECKDLVVESAVYHRLCQLVVESNPVLDPAGLRKGDCLISCDRSQLVRRRQQLARLGISTAVLWGSMPPAIRKKQLKRFENGEVDVLLATDAVGLGVNLKINRVVLDSLQKFDGEKIRNLTFAEIRQLSGRAGRFGQGFEKGQVAVMHLEDLPRLHLSLLGVEKVDFERDDLEELLVKFINEDILFKIHKSSNNEQTNSFPSSISTMNEVRSVASLMDTAETNSLRIVVGPSPEAIEAFAFQLENEAGRQGIPLGFALQKFAEIAQVRNRDTSTVVDMRTYIAIAEALQDIKNLPRSILLEFIFAPVDLKSPTGLGDLRTFAEFWSATEKVFLPPWLDYVSMVRKLGADTIDPPRTFEGLSELETVWASLDVYLWLFSKFGESRFPDHKKARRSQQILEQLMDAAIIGPLSLDLSVEQNGDRSLMANTEFIPLVNTLKELVAEGYVFEDEANLIIGQEAVTASFEFGDVSQHELRQASILKKESSFEANSELKTDENGTKAKNISLSLSNRLKPLCQENIRVSNMNESEKIARDIESDDWLTFDMLERSGSSQPTDNLGDWNSEQVDLVRPMVERLKSEGAWLSVKQKDSLASKYRQRLNKRGREKRLQNQSMDDWIQMTGNKQHSK